MKLPFKKMISFFIRKVSNIGNMIKLKYKPVYYNQFLTPGYIILEKIASRYDDGYVKTSRLIFFDWNGNKKAEKTVEGYVLNIKDGKYFIKSYDDKANEYFRIEPVNLDIKNGDKNIKGHANNFKVSIACKSNTADR